MQLLWAQHLANLEHNRATEAIQARNVDVQEQHYTRQDMLSAEDLKEKIRHQQAQDAETMRHNQATEEEIANHNRAVESIEVSANNLKYKIAKLENQTRLKIANEQNLTNKEIAAAKRDLDKTIAEWNTALQSSKNWIDMQAVNNTTQKIKNDFNVGMTQAQAAVKNAHTNAGKLALDEEKWELEKVYEGIDSISNLISVTGKAMGKSSYQTPSKQAATNSKQAAKSKPYSSSSSSGDFNSIPGRTKWNEQFAPKAKK
jgi:hypothetical protein